MNQDICKDSQDESIILEGTPAYWPPELLEMYLVAPKHDLVFGPISQVCHPAVDTWAIGCILYILMSGCHPFDPDGILDDEQVAERAIKGQYDLSSGVWDHISQEAKELITLLLQKNAKDRFTADQALNHPWLREIDTVRTQPLPNSDARLRKWRQSLRHKLLGGVFAIAFAQEARQLFAKGNTSAEMQNAEAALKAIESSAKTENVHLTLDQLEDIREAFAVFDQDGDGTITNLELASVLDSLGLRLSHEQIAVCLTLQRNYA